jgi:hypothetical protein
MHAGALPVMTHERVDRCTEEDRQLGDVACFVPWDIREWRALSLSDHDQCEDDHPCAISGATKRIQEEGNVASGQCEVLQIARLLEIEEREGQHKHTEE